MVHRPSINDYLRLIVRRKRANTTQLKTEFLFHRFWDKTHQFITTDATNRREFFVINLLITAQRRQDPTAIFAAKDNSLQELLNGKIQMSFRLRNRDRRGVFVQSIRDPTVFQALEHGGIDRHSKFGI